MSVSFLHFQSLLRFYEEPNWLWRTNMVIIIDEIVFFQSQIFHEKWNSYVKFFLGLCFTPFKVDVTVITFLLSQIYVFANSYRLFNIPGRKWANYFQNFIYKFFKTYSQSSFVPSLVQIEQILNKLEKGVSGLRPATLFKKRLWHRCFLVNSETFLRSTFLQNTSGRLFLTFEGSFSMKNLKLGCINHNYYIFKNVLYNISLAWDSF